ncbi:hypothetical protein K3217_23110 [bacterium BD-1]|nr:hypothetical protein [Ottowia caeni]
MFSVLLSLALAAAQPASSATDHLPPMPETRASDVAASLNAILKKETGNASDVTDGTWLVLFGSEKISPERLSAINLTKVTSIDVLTRRNGSFQGTVVLSVSE